MFPPRGSGVAYGIYLFIQSTWITGVVKVNPCECGYFGRPFYYLEQNPDSVENENWGRKSDWRTARVNGADERGGTCRATQQVQYLLKRKV